MNYILFDGPSRDALLPFTYTRPVADIRIGILTIREKWEKRLGSTTSTSTEDYLADRYPMLEMQDNILINASFLPTKNLVEMIKRLKPNEAIFHKQEAVAFYKQKEQKVDFETYRVQELKTIGIIVKNTWDIFSKNYEAIQDDFLFLTKNRKSQPIAEGCQVLSPENIFIEEGAALTFAALNASNGPIYIGKDAVIMEHSSIQGPFSLGEKSIIKMGSRIYGGTTIGPQCKVGGEVENSVFFGYSNKGHEGYLGNTVIGEWCNIGADTNTSNLKNNYTTVRLWSYKTKNFANTGLQFCGLMMGDHSKCGINTMFNTGTVVGVNANIFGSGFPRNFVPSFSWGGNAGFRTYLTKKAFEVCEIVMARKDKVFTLEDKKIMEYVFKDSSEWRKD